MLAAGGAHAYGAAFLGLAAGTLAFVLAHFHRISARNAGGPEPRVPGPAGGTVLLQARLALAAICRGRALAALRAEPQGDTLGGLPIVALRVALAPGLDVLVGHRGVLPAGVRIRAGDAFPGYSAAGPLPATLSLSAERSPRGDALAAILGNIEQTMFGEPLYASREEKAAHLLYFVVKDHPFTDGNKRIGSLLFLLYLKQEGIEHGLNPQALTALTLLVAESAPAGKNLMIRLIVNLLVETSG